MSPRTFLNKGYQSDLKRQESKTLSAYLWLYVQHSNFALIVDLVDCLELGPEHKSLEAAVLQQLVFRDAFGHVLVGHEVILQPVFLVLPLGSGGVCKKTFGVQE